MQGGFRERRSTLDQAAVLQQVMTTRYGGYPTLVVFLDIKAAYDSVDRQLLWGCCTRMGIPDGVIKMLRGMFDHNISRVVIDGSGSGIVSACSKVLPSVPSSMPSLSMNCPKH